MPPEAKSAKLFSFPGRSAEQTALDDDYILRLVGNALDEDLGKAGDITGRALVDPHLEAEGIVIANQDGVIAGLRCAALAFRLLEETSDFQQLVKDGDTVSAGAHLARVRASARTLLAAERTALNFLGRLSGIATLTGKYTDAIAHTKARILDTRKTMPGLRLLEKYAVRCGGGSNHRLGLHDAALIKDNHIALCGGVTAALKKAKEALGPAVENEIEVDTLQQLEEALNAGAKRILLDNMDIAMLKKAVAQTKGRAMLEASGGVMLQNVKAVAETGVDFISIGALTHSAPNFDVSLDVTHT